MRLTTLFLADHASVDAAGKIYVNGGAITRVSEPLPGKLPQLSLLACFRLASEDFLQQHRLELRVRRPDGSELARLPSATVGPFERKALPYEDQTFTVVAQFGGLPLAQPGRYSFELLVDGELVGTSSLAAVPPSEESSVSSSS